ncbi:MAG: nickel pincer cofactor biosynthesis protein LarC [Thermodesulfobacteriota bacterium]
MKIIYFDCFSGASGDMVVGSLLDLGVDTAYLREELSKLPVSGYRIETRKEARHHIFGTRFKVKVDKSGHPHRNHTDIIKIIETSSLGKRIKERSLKVFKRLANAEAKIHHVKIEDVVFHEVGAVDSIVDIVGASIALEALGIEKVYSSSLPLGSGFVNTAHGKLPVPAPATLEVLRGFPVTPSPIKKELTTPTGGSLMATLSSGNGGMPPLNIKNIGYGVGGREFKEQPNLLRAVLGENESGFDLESLIVLETNIDDMNPQVYDYLLERLFDMGALDVFLIPVQMKKNRPGVLLKVLTCEEKSEALARIIFDESTTLGIRSYRVERLQLPRELKEIDTPYGTVKIKVAEKDGKICNIQPEYEACKKIAKEKEVPLRTVLEEAVKAYKDLKIR